MCYQVSCSPQGSQAACLGATLLPAVRPSQHSSLQYSTYSCHANTVLSLSEMLWGMCLHDCEVLHVCNILCFEREKKRRIQYWNKVDVDMEAGNGSSICIGTWLQVKKRPDMPSEYSLWGDSTLESP